MSRWIALLSRYRSVLLIVWKNRQSLESPKRLSYEAEFLPAALSLQEKPVSPLPRLLAYLLISFALIALLWSILGKIEIVAVAKGKIIPNGYTKVIQPLETATVKAIYVTDGQQVRAGDVLIDLDATQPSADLDQITAELLTTRLAAVIAQSFLDALNGRNSSFVTMSEAKPADIQGAKLRLESELAEYYAKRSKLDAEITQHQTAMQTSQELIRKLEQTAPIAQQRAGDYKNLLDRNFISRHGYLEKEQFRIEQDADLASQRARLKEIASQLETTRRQREAFIAETRRLHVDALNEAQIKIKQLIQEQRKADRRRSLMQLTAPVDGVVQQMVVHTVGGVVTPAQALMSIVPQDNKVEVEAFVQNKDIGFVFEGQDVTLKLETFPFTKYGTIPGKIKFVSNDAATDEKLGLIYAARIELKKTQMQIGKKLVNLGPGMAVTAEIKIGTRRVIEYFLSPLLQYSNESLRER